MTTLGLASIIQEDNHGLKCVLYSCYALMDIVLGFYIKRLDARTTTDWNI